MALALSLMIIALAGATAIELNETYRLRRMLDARVEALRKGYTT